jgi:hypothetical protein
MSLSESASAQVQAILQAAETSAAEIKREAEAEAEHIRAAARENQQADVSGLLEMVAKLRADLDGLEARLREVAKEDAPAPPQAAAKPETAKTTRAPKSPPPAPKDEEADAEGARLIALNMALNGEPREATDKYLAENFSLSDRDTLLDEVYASVEG